MTAQILASELGTLIQESKRKNTELRTTAEKALQDLRSLPVTSETQLTADLSRRPHFISPFLIACGTHNAKYAFTGIACLQRLSVSRALPRERLTEVLEALRESVSLSHDVQLRILQALPSLLQNYPVEVKGDLLSIALQICSALQTAKNPAVSNTAAATLQQLVISVFDRVVSEDEKALEIPTNAEVTGDGRSVAVRPAAHDAYKVFNDLNLLLTGEKPTFIRFSSIPSTSTLELIEAILSNYGRIMTTHSEQVHILRSLLMPMIIRSLSDKLSFPVSVRIFRVLNLIIRNYLTIMPSECEIALGLLNHMLDPGASPLWKRALCLEVYRGIYSDSRLVLEIYNHFDEQQGKRCIFGDNLGAFVRLATEKPAVIGLGEYSTAPATHGTSKDVASEQAVAEAGALAGVIGGPVAESNTTGHHIGISIEWSSLKTPCMEHLDKNEPPTLPETYVYGLVLTCITNVSEGLAKFILPLTVHHESRSRRKSKGDDLSRTESESASAAVGDGYLSRTQSYRKKTIPVNPLTLTGHSAHSYIQTTCNLVSECWPAVLATCSTFLNAALDTDYYRALVRAIQKFTQVAGLLRLSTPRDAFFTTLGKAAVPSNLLHGNISSPKTPTPESGVFSNAKGLLSVDSLVNQASSLSLDRNRRPSHEISVPTLGPRNLLCLRALLNLAIALGPTLQSAWSIIFETLQVADLVLAMSNQQSSARATSTPGMRTDFESALEKVEAETTAVQAAARRLFESTVDFPNDAFVELLRALCTLLHAGSASESGQRTPTSVRPQLLHQRRVSSISLSTENNARDAMFALNKIGELAALNEERLSQYEPSESGWSIFVTELVRFSADDRRISSARLLAADIMSRTVKEIAQQSMADAEQRNEVQGRILAALQTQISALHGEDGAYDTYDDTDVRIHQVALEALRSVIEQCGEFLISGWDSVFSSLLSVFAQQISSTGDAKSLQVVPNSYKRTSVTQVKVISKVLTRSAFGSVQLVCSDFLAAVPDTSLSILLELLLKFCGQQEDLNISLTAITFYWNVSDFFHSRSDLTTLPSLLSQHQERDKVLDIVQQQSQQGNMATLWLLVLLNLSNVTTDKRAELRNSAVHTIQRIFENHADEMSPETWMLCLRTVVFSVVECNLAVHKGMRGDEHITKDEIKAWNETNKTVLSSVSSLLATYIGHVSNAPGLSAAWSDLVDYFRAYFDCASHALGASVFKTISGVFTKIERPDLIGTVALRKTGTVWKEYFRYRETWLANGEKNQEAFLSYAEAFKSIYRLAGDVIDGEVPSMLINLEACVKDSDGEAYSSDIDHMTPLQVSVLDCLSLVDSTRPGLPAVLIQMLSRFTVLPYSVAVGQEKGVPTFVALSKASMDLLQVITIKHIDKGDIYVGGAFQLAMASLARPITEKYLWQREGKVPTIWQKATTSAVVILEAAIPHLHSHSLKADTSKDIWSQVIQIAGGITGAKISSDNPPITVEKDESFDVKAFTTLRGLITLPLGSSAIPDSLRRSYTRKLFETSIIHLPMASEIPSLTAAPLEDLYKIRFGHTNDPEPVLRTEMAFVCYTELVSLVAARDGTAERVRLAQAAAPYLILRAALTLKAYIADQPLRGRLPAPETQRRELVFTLKELKTLKSEPQAIPDAPGVTSTHRKHLHRLYPLLIRATKVARRDAEVFEHLVGLTDIVGEEFGLDDE
ncbi:hypothetical protein K491DRAFT_714379 [Lophiostoma macrostomum CBS 122681]|uniref:Endosomal peripheral membrane protein-like protein n=1 Tax=Lophiostoma macrostomum CBS 122681 TaxID=1314788 RepID=A0A6A6TD09_9PLEO|nr:hypothetical protein K491DRAFT_714379 [Lophiostoma macrostomum CBS 122681]